MGHKQLGCELDYLFQGKGATVSSFEHGFRNLRTVKGREFLEQLSN
jgi:hypothetical protein